ncbi:MAG: cation-translocating P-type ATPase [Clostridia bacterium]|nr:cation-translocating P-type ATPase [Clostridia bacterium]
MENQQVEKSSKFQEILILSIVPSIVLFLILASFGLEHWNLAPVFITAGIALLATFLGGIQRFFYGIKDLLHGRITVNVFVTVSLAATMAIGEFLSAAIVIFIMAVAGAVESYALDKSRKGIQDLLDLAPKTATIIKEGREEAVPVEDVQIGNIIVVKPGEGIPVDGIVVSGSGSVNQAAITGESVPAHKTTGSELFAGTLNETGRLEFEATKVGEDTTLAKIVHRVEEAHELKAPIQKIADRFTAWFLPIVLLAAALGYYITRDIKSAVSILLVAAPCALSIGTPTAVTAGIANMSRRGVIVKGGLFFELAGKVNALLIDKTGTFTVGHPKVLDIIPSYDSSKEEVLHLAAVAEKYSEHPLAKAVLDFAKEKSITVQDPDDFMSEVGLGVTAVTSDKKICVGRTSFLRNKGISIPAEIEKGLTTQEELGRTSILVSKGDCAIGLIAIADKIRPETKGAVNALSEVLGIENLHMLTGDNQASAQAVAKQIGVTNVHAELLPEDKQEYVRKLQKAGQKVAMIGDGINDAPALALADVGIAMGSSGTDVAIETADVALMNDDLTKVAEFVVISRRVVRRIKLNIFFSMVFNLIGIILGNLGLLTPVIAIIFQEAGTITVIISSTLLLWATPNINKKICEKVVTTLSDNPA